MNEDDELEYLKVPVDFPRTVAEGAIPGTQPKFSVMNYGGRFYMPGCTPPEIYERWQICEEIAQQLTIKLREAKEGKRSQMSEAEILAQYLSRLIRTNLTSKAEAWWVIQRVAAILEWPIQSLDEIDP
ncbi:hypothetical protein HH212_07195 [Massilia forsythiae]|uniref:Uncharacterized protein n=1 Tax=Massilia forsythiae TaxID=2728020 RepID=A0A7Z2VVF7_9BURK|nr:hypothetical protein [Massilia forsythiae]QJD99834.1 hypothetical protein HH212_07195 [Massilia forsythiae]